MCPSPHLASPTRWPHVKTVQHQVYSTNLAWQQVSCHLVPTLTAIPARAPQPVNIFWDHISHPLLELDPSSHGVPCREATSTCQCSRQPRLALSAPQSQQHPLLVSNTRKPVSSKLKNCSLPSKSSNSQQPHKPSLTPKSSGQTCH